MQRVINELVTYWLNIALGKLIIIFVYPAIFLYRQYIELRLKEMVQNSYWCLGIPKYFPKHHKIDELWKICRSNIEKMDADEIERMDANSQNQLRNDLNALEEDINAFSKLDSNSITFRYPIDKDGKPLDLPKIDLRKMRDLVGRISYWLDGASVGIEESLKAKHEYEHELIGQDLQDGYNT